MLSIVFHSHSFSGSQISQLLTRRTQSASRAHTHSQHEQFTLARRRNQEPHYRNICGRVLPRLVDRVAWSFFFGEGTSGRRGPAVGRTVDPCGVPRRKERTRTWALISVGLEEGKEKPIVARILNP